MNTLTQSHRRRLFQALVSVRFVWGITAGTTTLLWALTAEAASPEWNNPGLGSNLQALVTTCAQGGGIGAGLRVEDAVLGKGTVVAGWSRWEPSQAWRPGERFRIASCSKTFTAAAVFLLKEQGLLDFDLPIARYLPQFEIPRKDIITIRHLLTHTSGLPDHNNESDFLFEQLAIDPLTYFTPSQICTLISRMTNNFAPGEQWRYCDTGFYLLHLIIAGVNTNGWTYQQFVERNLIEPSGLTNTFVPGPDNDYLATLPGGHARGYTLDQSANWVDATVLNQSFDLGCGGMVSSLEDLCAWARALYTGRVISTNSLAEMLTITPQSLAKNVPYGMGAMVSPALGFGHGGATPGYFTRFYWDPLRQTAYASAVNAFNPARGDTAWEMAQKAKGILGYPDVENPRYANTIAASTGLINELMGQRQVKGLSIALVESNRIVWAQGFGQAEVTNHIAASAQTVYRIGSVSKVVTAAALLKLAEDGRLDLEAPITNYIPEFSILPRFGGNRAPTVRECLNHQSGLPGDLFKGGFTTRPMPGYNDWLLDYLASDYPNYPVGLRSIYNNTGFQLSEEALVRITGGSLNDYAETNLFAPLGMTSSSYIKNKASIARRLARSYDQNELLPEEFVNAYGTGGMYSSVEDMAHLIMMFLAEGRYGGMRILAANSVAAMMTDQTTHRVLDVDSESRFGLGWDSVSSSQLNYAGRVAVKDGAPMTCFCNLTLLRDQQLGVVIIQNATEDIPDIVAPEVLKQAVLEKSGLHWPTNYVAPFSPVTNWSPEALQAVSGCYVTASGMANGYDFIQAGSNSLTWIQNAHTAAPVIRSGWVPRANRRFSSPDSQALELELTNLNGHAVMIVHAARNYGPITALLGEKYEPAPIPPVWSNRTATTWLAIDLLPEDFMSRLPPCLTLTQRHNLLWMENPMGTFVVAPSNDNLGFAVGLTSRRGASVLVTNIAGAEHIRSSSYTYRRADTIPTLPEGQTTAGTLTENQTTWFKFDAAAGLYYGILLTNTNARITLSLRSGDSGENATKPTTSGHLGWECTSTGSYFLGLNSTSATPYAVRLYTLTNTITRLTSLITNLMAGNNLVGCGLSLVDGDHTVWQTGFGSADRERGIPATKDTVFMIGSCSKTFGAIAAMQLVEEGLLDLDAPLTNVLPSFRIRQRFADNIITPRTILTHHSGLPGDIFNNGFTVRPYYDAPDRVQAILAEETTLMPVNTYWSYNNSGFAMLGQAFRHLTGQELPAFARTRLFDRMGMTNSSVVCDLPYFKEHLSRPYIGGEVYPHEYCNLFFAGSIYSTAADMARYMRMLLQGGMGDQARVISNATLVAMSTRQNAAIPLDQFCALPNMGLGFALDPAWLTYMGKVIWHDGGTVYFRTLMRVATAAQLGCFISGNSAEAGGANEQIVSSALRWAYEEKTGIAPPAPGGPGEPAPSIAPPEVLALATGGVFVTGTGFDRFATNQYGLLAHLGAQVEGHQELQLVYRDNGSFTPTNAYEPQIAFTQSVGHALCLFKSFVMGVTNISLHGERAADIAGFNPAWSQRLGRWWAIDLNPDDISWLLPGSMCHPMIELYANDELLSLAPMANRAEGSYVMSATNDVLAFAAGLGRNKGSSLRALGEDALAFLGVHYRAETGIPVLALNSSTNGSTAGSEIYWWRIPASPGTPVTIDLATEHDLTAYLYDTNASLIGQANRAHAFHLAASNAVPLLAAIVRNGTNTGPWRLTAHTQAVPFHQVVPFAQWPAQFAAKSNLFPRTEFGFVFVRENHSAPSGNVLKLAVASMAATNAAAQPLIFCNGGPGNWSIFSMYQHELKTHFSDYDLYLPDQRGVGFSQPNLDKRPEETDNEALYRLCFLQGGDYATIHTAESALDLLDIHTALGLGQANLWGLSYGTMLVEELMRLGPPWLRAVILDGVLAPNRPPYRGVGAVVDHALTGLFHDVAADPLAAHYYPDFETTFKQFAAGLQTQPLEWVDGGRTNRIDGATFIDCIAYAMLFSDLGNRHLIPGIVWRIMRGEPRALLELVQRPGQTEAILDNGYTPLMNRLVLRHDFAPFDSLAAVTNANASLWSPLREYADNFAQKDLGPALSISDVGSAGPTFTQAVSSAVATLCINGCYDPQTGTNWAAEVARQLPNSQLVLVPTVGHQILFGGDCPRRLVREFLQNPGRPLDTSCLDHLALSFPAPWPAGAPPLALGTSITASNGQSGSPLWYQIQPANPPAGVGGVSNIYYQVTLCAAPDTFLLRLYDSADATCVAERRGNGPLQVSSGQSPLLLTVLPGPEGTQTGTCELAFSVPLAIRQISLTPPAAALVWQGPTNLLLTIEAASRLGADSTFQPLMGNIHSTTILQRETVPLDFTTNHFYRIKAEE